MSQVRRAAAFVPANLAEGRSRGSDRDFGRFVQVAIGSATELDYHLLLARDLGYLDLARYEPLASRAEEVRRMLIALSRTLRGATSTGGTGGTESGS